MCVRVLFDLPRMWPFLLLLATLLPVAKVVAMESSLDTMLDSQWELWKKIHRKDYNGKVRARKLPGAPLGVKPHCTKYCANGFFVPPKRAS